MSTTVRDRIVSYLGQGIQQSVVASSCGVTPAYVSQLLELEEVREAVALLRSKELEVSLETDRSIERIERKALEMVDRKLPFVKNATEAAKVFATLNAARKKAVVGDQASDVAAAQQVVITVPKGAQLLFKLNPNNQVIEVEGRSMATLPSSGLAAIQQRLRGETPEVETLAVKSQVAPKQRVVEQDEKRALDILGSLTAVMDGVTVVL